MITAAQVCSAQDTWPTAIETVALFVAVAAVAIVAIRYYFGRRT
jgi:hypothetical protein